MAVVVINDAWDIKGEVSFDEYNHKTKKSKQVERTLTENHKILGSSCQRELEMLS
jgi:thiamine monophosphate synthase